MRENARKIGEVRWREPSHLNASLCFDKSATRHRYIGTLGGTCCATMGGPTWRRRSSKGFAPRQEPDGRHRSKTATSMNGRGEQPNTGLDLTNPDAAQSVASAPLCLLSGLAAQAHVRLAENALKR